MATIHREIQIDARPADGWAAVRDVGNVHTRLVPGLVTNVVLEDGARMVTFAGGFTVRELIVTVDDDARRFAYASTGGRAMHHNASLQVFDGVNGGTRLVWITDCLPDEAAAPIGALVEQGATIMQATLARASANI